METSSTQTVLQEALGAQYAIERELGRGGMATVYLARDVRHRRQVAIKVLHPELSAILGPDRFLREIEVTASLQHPHILPLFDSGSVSPGLLYYVMPYVPGESLRARLQRERQLPIDEAIRLAREVADALDHAHRQGVVHRDIKPENILLGYSRGGGASPAGAGHALVADFGVALAVQQAGGERMTQTGLSLGTPQYMAPEQATGEKTVDARADVYALGAVTYEMLTGEPPFAGGSTQVVIAKLLTDDPVPLTRHRRSVPPHVEAAVLRALEKLPADRMASAGAFAAALVDPAVAYRAASRSHGGRATLRRHVSFTMLAGVATATLVAGLALGWALGRGGARVLVSVARPPVRFTIDIDSGSFGHVGALAISPDGRTVVYGVDGPDGNLLYARRLDSLVARRLPGTEDAELPFFSPDGAWVAFYSHGALRKVALAGGPAAVVVEVPLPSWFGGGTWGNDDTIIYAVPTSNALYRVPARGGRPSTVVVNDTLSATPFYPHMLPNGRALFVALSTWDFGERVAVLDLESGRLRSLGAGFSPHYAAGNLIYTGQGGELFSQPFDIARAEPTGAAKQIVAGLAFQMAGSPFDVASTGALVYRPGSSSSAEDYLKLKLIDRMGRELQAFPGRLPWAPRFSPDGRRVAYGAVAPGHENTDIWVRDIDAGTTQRVTTDGNNNNDVQWSPDGARLAFSANAPGGKDLFVQPLDGGPASMLTRRPGNQVSTDWTSNGDAVLLIDLPRSGGERSGNQDIWIQPSNGGEPRPYLTTVAHENAARVSPDGKWVAYQSDETGRYEVYVQAYPTPGRRWSVSVRGGFHPVWARNGRELFFWRGDQLMAVTVTPGPANEPLRFGTPTPLFRAPYPKGTSLAAAMYDVAPDGRFVVVTSHDRESRLVVALDALGADAPR